MYDRLCDFCGVHNSLKAAVKCLDREIPVLNSLTGLKILMWL